MPHDITRILRAFSSTPLFMDGAKAEAIVAMLALRAKGRPRADFGRARQAAPAALAGGVAVIPLVGAIMSRGAAMEETSGVETIGQFRAQLKAALADPAVARIVLDIDSAGGTVDGVPEAAAQIRASKKPITAVANTEALSAAYWIASAADELVVTPSGKVGSVGVYMV
ncbi:MAG: S49 family peptidase, partial [Pseudomonadota bacterium]